jgi:hypothetical protein
MKRQSESKAWGGALLEELRLRGIVAADFRHADFIQATAPFMPRAALAAA